MKAPRIVRCPGCFSILVEPEGCTQYECGKCSRILNVKPKPIKDSIAQHTENEQSELNGYSRDSSVDERTSTDESDLGPVPPFPEERLYPRPMRDKQREIVHRLTASDDERLYTPRTRPKPFFYSGGLSSDEMNHDLNYIHMNGHIPVQEQEKLVNNIALHNKEEAAYHDKEVAVCHDKEVAVCSNTASPRKEPVPSIVNMDKKIGDDQNDIKARRPYEVYPDYYSDNLKKEAVPVNMEKKMENDQDAMCPDDYIDKSLKSFHFDTGVDSAERDDLYGASLVVEYDPSDYSSTTDEVESQSHMPEDPEPQSRASAPSQKEESKSSMVSRSAAHEVHLWDPQVASFSMNQVFPDSPSDVEQDTVNKDLHSDIFTYAYVESYPSFVKEHGKKPVELGAKDNVPSYFSKVSPTYGNGKPKAHIAPESPPMYFSSKLPVNDKSEPTGFQDMSPPSSSKPFRTYRSGPEPMQATSPPYSSKLPPISKSNRETSSRSKTEHAVRAGSGRIICQNNNCRRLLEVPSNLPSSKESTHKIRCGVCRQISTYQIYLPPTAAASSSHSDINSLSKSCEPSSQNNIHLQGQEGRAVTKVRQSVAEISGSTSESSSPSNNDNMSPMNMTAEHESPESHNGLDNKQTRFICYDPTPSSEIQAASALHELLGYSTFSGFFRNPSCQQELQELERGPYLTPQHEQEMEAPPEGNAKGFFQKFKELTKSTARRGSGKRKVVVNGKGIPDAFVVKAEEYAGPIHPGNYWYDSDAGFWGVAGGPCLGIIPPFIEELSYPMSRDCSNGRTGILVNGRELHEKDALKLFSRGLPSKRGGSFIITIDGVVKDSATQQRVVSLGNLAPTIKERGRGYGMYPNPPS